MVMLRPSITPGETVPTTPTPMRALMDDPIFRAYMKQIPSLPPALRTGDPWQVWVHRGEGRWGTALRSTYRDAWTTFLHHYRADDHRDVTLVSRRVFYAPPGEWYKVKVRIKRRPTPDNPATSQFRVENRWRQTFYWDAVDLHWCGRCRRPTYWMPLFADHHALRKYPAVSDEDNYRCIVCGIRWVATPAIDQMVKVEKKP